MSFMKPTMQGLPSRVKIPASLAVPKPDSIIKLLSGPTGSGKSTSIAAMVQSANARLSLPTGSTKRLPASDKPELTKLEQRINAAITEHGSFVLVAFDAVIARGDTLGKLAVLRFADRYLAVDGPLVDIIKTCAVFVETGTSETRLNSSNVEAVSRVCRGLWYDDESRDVVDLTIKRWERGDDIVSIIVDREIMDAPTISVLLDEMGEVHPAMSEGVL